MRIIEKSKPRIIGYCVLPLIAALCLVGVSDAEYDPGKEPEPVVLEQPDSFVREATIADLNLPRAIVERGIIDVGKQSGARYKVRYTHAGQEVTITDRAIGRTGRRKFTEPPRFLVTSPHSRAVYECRALPKLGVYQDKRTGQEYLLTTNEHVAMVKSSASDVAEGSSSAQDDSSEPEACNRTNWVADAVRRMGAKPDDKDANKAVCILIAASPAVNNRDWLIALRFTACMVGSRRSEAAQTRQSLLNEYPKSPAAALAGLDAMMVACGTCAGKGSYMNSCPSCDGKGKCPDCNGYGVIIKSDGRKGCILCDSTGKCPRCKGTGQVPYQCSACKGKGKTLSDKNIRDIHNRVSAETAKFDWLSVERQYETSRGRMDYNGQWMMADEATNRMMTAKGLVKYEGNWMTPKAMTNEMMTAQGLLEYDGKWMTPPDMTNAIMTAKGMVQYKGEWIPASEATNRMKTSGVLVEYDGQLVSPVEKTNRSMTAMGLVMYKGEWMKRDDITNRVLLRRQQLAEDLEKLLQQRGSCKGWKTYGTTIDRKLSFESFPQLRMYGNEIYECTIGLKTILVTVTKSYGSAGVAIVPAKAVDCIRVVMQDGFTKTIPVFCECVENDRYDEVTNRIAALRADLLSIEGYFEVYQATEQEIINADGGEITEAEAEAERLYEKGMPIFNDNERVIFVPISDGSKYRVNSSYNEETEVQLEPTDKCGYPQKLDRYIRCGAVV